MVCQCFLLRSGTVIIMFSNHNKKGLLRERKRHTARRVASTGYPTSWDLTWMGVPPTPCPAPVLGSDLDRGDTCPLSWDLTWMGGTCPTPPPHILGSDLDGGRAGTPLDLGRGCPTRRLDLGRGTPFPPPGPGKGVTLPPPTWTWEGGTPHPHANVNRQTPVKTVHSLVLRTRAVKNGLRLQYTLVMCCDVKISSKHRVTLHWPPAVLLPSLT